jgi:hypothetical protein
MARIWMLLLVLGAGVAWAEAPVRVFRRTLPAEEGGSATLFRYVPVGGGKVRAPVLLVPDFGFRRDVFDLDGRGLAPWLTARGFEVYVLEPGAGRELTDLVRRDLPAAVTAIRAHRTGPVDLIAHGYAGTLALAASTRELKGEVGKVVALSTPVVPEIPNTLAEAVLARGGKLTRLSLDPAGAASFDLLFAKHGRFPGRVLTDLRATGVVDLGDEAAAELLGWMRSGDLSLGDGTSVKSRLAGYDRSTLQFLALRDNWAHPEFASPLRELAAGADVKLRTMSLLQYHAEDYTHLSLLQGEGAPSEVFEPIREFLTGEVAL